MIDFLKVRYLNIGVSVSFLLLSAFGWYRYGINYSVDFDGGTQVRLSFSQPVKSEEVKKVLNEKGWVSANLQEFSPTDLRVRVKEFAGDAAGVADRLKGALAESLPGNEIIITSKDNVGPTAGASLRTKALYLVFIGLFLMLLYILVRFEFSFAFGAVMSLFHDALTILGVFIVLGHEVSPNVIIAILTILGYSIHDTIVIYARIRENMGKMAHSSMYDIVNTSINQTLTRTILTSFATALTVLSFYIFGGEALHDLALALLIGIGVGTYSSIYIASPIMMMLHKSGQ